MDMSLNYYFIGLGFALIGLESIILSFFVVWFGFAFLIVGFLCLSINYENFIIESIISLLLSLVFTFLYKKHFSKKLDTNPELDKNFLDEVGYGFIMNGKLSYKGSFFNVINEDNLKDNEKVKVLHIHLNDATIEKIEDN